MAMDTAGERYSAINVGSPWRGLNYLPTGTVDTQERQAIAYLYAGIVSGLSPPVFAGPIPDISKTENTGTFSYDLGAYFTGETSLSIAPAVEAGWSFNTSTGELVIDTDAVGVFGGYVVTGTNAAGSSDSNSFTVTVVAVATTAGDIKRRKYKKLQYLDDDEAIRQVIKTFLKTRGRIH